MTDPLDTLRNDIARAAHEGNEADRIYVRPFDELPEAHRESKLRDADHIIEKVFAAASGEERHTILRLLGFEVRHGWMLEWETRGEKCWAVDPSMVGLEGEPTPEDVPVLVLRDQRDAS